MNSITAVTTAALHSMDTQAVVHCRPTLKAFLEVWLNPGGVLGLRQDLQHLIIGQEEEAREGNPLDLQVGSQALLDVLQQPVVLDQPCQPLLVPGNAQAARQLGGTLHHLMP